MALPSMFRSFNQTCGVGLSVHSRVARFQETADLELGPAGSRFRWRGAAIELRLAGRHNVANALAAATAAEQAGIGTDAVAAGDGGGAIGRAAANLVDAGFTGSGVTGAYETAAMAVEFMENM